MSPDARHPRGEDHLVDRLDAWGGAERAGADANLKPLKITKNAEESTTPRIASTPRVVIIRRVGAAMAAAAVFVLVTGLIWTIAHRSAPTAAPDSTIATDHETRDAYADLLPTSFALLRINQDRVAESLILPERYDISWASQASPLGPN